MKKIYIISLFILAAVFCLDSCKREPIVYATSNYYLAIDSDPGVSDVGSIYSVNFYNQSTGSLVYQTFIYADQHPEGKPRGGYLTGIEPGNYNMLVYSFDSKSDYIRNENQYGKVYTDTEVLNYNNGTPIIKEPQPLLEWSKETGIPYVTGKDIHIIYIQPENVIEKWSVNVSGVKNLDRAQKITFLLSGQSRGRFIGLNQQKLNDKAILSFNGNPEDIIFRTKAEEGELILVTTYHTFGKLEADQRCLLTLQIEGPGGMMYYAQEDVTSQITDPDNTGHGINMETDIDIEPLKDGGFDPKADPWDDEITKIELD